MNIIVEYQPVGFLWPDGVKRTRWRAARWRYSVTLDIALRDMRAEVDRWRPPDGRLELGIDRGRKVEDPGVVARFSAGDGRTVCAACDGYTERMPNARAITLFLEAIRRMERDGCHQLIEQMAAGRVFTALPAPARFPWSVLGLSAKPETEDEVKSAYRARAQELHPDRDGGDNKAMVELTSARDAALKIMKGVQR
jgi:DnaJ domain